MNAFRKAMREPARILLMARALDLGGIERQLALLARKLDRRRFDPRVACFRCAGIRAEELRAHGVPLVPLGVRSFAGPSAVAGAWRLVRYLREHEVKLVHSFDPPATVFGIPLARAAQVPVVLSSQRGHRALTLPRTRHWLRLTDQMVDAIVVNCEFLKRHLIEDERVPAGRIRVCHNGLELERFSPEGRNKPAELGPARLIFGTVCAFRPEKGLDVLLEAFARLHAAIPEAMLVLVGDGPLRQELQRQATVLGLGECCRFLPACRDVEQILRAIDVFVLPSRSEALSNALMEAMACGCCAVATRVGGNPELVEDGRTGVLVPPDDVAALAGALRFLAENEPVRKRLAGAGADFVRSQFSEEAAARRMAGIYEEFLYR